MVIKENKGTIQVSMNIDHESSAVFETFVEELKTSLNRLGIRFSDGSRGYVMQGSDKIGQITIWEPDKRFIIEWLPPHWQSYNQTTEIEVRFEAVDGGTRLIFEHRGWCYWLDDKNDILGWFASEVMATLFRAMSPEGLGDWLTDRGARRPFGIQARQTYRQPLYHYPNFQVILSELALTQADYLLEVGCGGGALIKEALKSGCRAAAIDHSPDMVQVAREVNHHAISAGRLKVLEADAHCLPFFDEMFTCAAMTSVLGFLSDPVAVFEEIRRVLRPGGRLVVAGSDPELRGTPAAPEPMASRLRFYEDDELRALAQDSGFRHVTILRYNLEQFAREVNIPEEHLSLFSGHKSRFLVASKDLNRTT